MFRTRFVLNIFHASHVYILCIPRYLYIDRTGKSLIQNLNNRILIGTGTQAPIQSVARLVGLHLDWPEVHHN